MQSLSCTAGSPFTNTKRLDVLFGRFDPLEAVAESASLEALAPPRVPQEISAGRLTLAVARKRVIIDGTGWPISGAKFDLTGTYGFDGVANLSIHANLSRTTRRWVSLALPAQGPAATLHFAGHLENLVLTPVLETAQVHR